jgi:glycosyltransferase involved in cell wall biosynthesis
MPGILKGVNLSHMSTKSILFDGQAFSFQQYGGISRYCCRLIDRLYRDKELDIKLSLVLSNNLHLEGMSLIRHHSFLPKTNIKGRGFVIRNINKFDFILKSVFQSFDIFHSTYYDPYFLAFINDRPSVLTVHDMIHELYPECFPDNRTDKHKDECIKRAAKIIAISQNTKNDLIRLKNVDASKISVIHLGPPFEGKEVVTKSIEPNAPAQYLLFVGTRNTYKNFGTLVRAARQLTNKFKDLYIVCAGGGNFKQSELELMQDNGVRSRFIQIPFENDHVLISLYINAAAFIFPSLYEGFGLPILESFACSCPAVLSNSSCFQEIAEDAALYFEPRNEQELVESILRVLFDKQTRSAIVERGKKRLGDFSWKKTAEKTKELYLSL